MTGKSADLPRAHRILPIALAALIGMVLPCSARCQQATLDALQKRLHHHPAADAERSALLCDLALAYRYVLPDSGLALATEARTWAVAKGDARAEIKAMIAQGWDLNNVARRREAKDILSQALDAAHQAGWPDLVMKAHEALGELESEQADTARSLEHVRAGLSAAERAQGRSSIAQLLLTRSLCLRMRASKEAALLDNDSAVALARNDRDTALLALCVVDRGLLHWTMGDKERAATDAAEALRLGERNGNAMVQSLAHELLGTLDEDRSQLEPSLDHFLQALRIAEKSRMPPLQALMLYSIGKVFSMMGDNARALEYAQRALDLSRSTEQWQMTAYALSDVAAGQASLNDSTQAMASLRELLALSRKLNDLDLQAQAEVLLGSVYNRFQAFGPALGPLQRALARFEHMGLAFDVQRCLLQLAYTVQNATDAELTRAGIPPGERFPTAVRMLRRALERSAAEGDLYMQQYLYEQLSSAHLSSGDAAQALDDYKQFHLLSDSMLNKDKTRSIEDLRIQYDTEKKEQEITLLGKDKEVQAREIEKQKLVRNGFIGGFALVMLFAGIFLSQRNRIGKEKKRSEDLLHNILPQEVAEELKATGTAAAKQFDAATILFTDFKDFTAVAEKLSPPDLVGELNACFKAFDGIITVRGIEKIKTIGDAYMCAGGLPDPTSSDPADVVHAALEMQDFMQQRKLERDAQGLPAFEMRVGIHTGPVVAGIVGVKKFAYDIWGDTVNIASRMESSGGTGRVNISGSTYLLVKDAPGFVFTPRGKVSAKGKGELEMYFVEQA